jgi:hypothetical protein
MLNYFLYQNLFAIGLESVFDIISKIKQLKETVKILWKMKN